MHTLHILSKQVLLVACSLIMVGSATGQKLQLDSIVRFDYFSGDTVPTEKTIFRYDNRKQQIEETVQVWSVASMEWQNRSRVSNVYRGDILESTTTWQYQAMAWTPENRILNVYNSLDDLAEVIAQEWDNNTGTWINLTSTQLGRITSDQTVVLHFRWDEDVNNWILLDSTISLRNEIGQVTSDTSYQWISFANLYIYAALTTYDYDSVGNLLLLTRFDFSTDSLMFLPGSRDSFDYDINGFQILSRFDIWNSQNQEWEPSLRIDRTSNDDGLLYMSKIFFLDFVSGLLMPTSRLEYTYADGLARSEADSLILSVKNIIYQGTFEVPDWKKHYYYSEAGVTRVRDKWKPHFLIYPNPAKRMIWVQGDASDLEQYRWVSAGGRIIGEGRLTGSGIIVPATHSQSVQILYLILTNKRGQDFTALPIVIQ